MANSSTSAERAHGDERHDERPGGCGEAEAARPERARTTGRAEAERIEAEKEASRRPRRAAKRSQSAPRTRPVGHE